MVTKIDKKDYLKKLDWFKRHWIIYTLIFIFIVLPFMAGFFTAIFNGIFGGNDSHITGDVVNEQIEQVEECIPNWECGNWFECSTSGIQKRICTDLNNCGTAENKPSETKTCEYEIQQIQSDTESETNSEEDTCPIDFSELTNRITCGKDSCSFEILNSQGLAKVGDYKLIPWGYKPGDMILASALYAKCPKGNNIGQNENYFYCDGTYIIFKETDNYGNIIQSKDLSVTLVVKDSNIVGSICEEI